MYPTKKPTPEELKAAKEIEHFVNQHGHRPAGLVAAMSGFHRTIQQHFTRTAISWFEYLAKLEPGEFDPRNEASVKFAKSIVATKEWDKSTLPYV